VAPEFDLIERLRTQPDTVWSITRNSGLRLNSKGHLERVETIVADFRHDRRWLALTRPAGRVDFAGRVLEWRVREVEGRAAWRPYAGAQGEVFDAARVGETVVVRHWQPGDRFQPAGFKVPAKLQNLFVTNKVARQERSRRLLAETASGEIFWVEGLRIGERFKVKSGTRQLLIWTWR
jgi:tRNA(Ile)-lysidine synthase